jgi:hypothetical protein
MENDTFPQPLIPAGNVLSLSLRNTIAFDKAYLYLDYIPQKYPNLRHLYLDQKVMHQEGVRTIYLSKTGGEEEKENVTNMTQGLISFFIYLFIYQSSFHKQISVKLLSKPHHSVDENYQKNTTQFLSRLPKSLRLLGTNIYHQDGIKVISEMNIVELDLIHSTNYIVEIEHLALLNQLRTLRTLRIGLRSCGNAFIHGLFLTHITKLVLRYSLDWLYIDWLLSLFPLLEDLDATAEGVTSGHFHVGSTYPKLKRLCIRHEVHPSFYHFMKYTVPNLEELHVNSYISRVARENGYHVDLTGWRLKRCSLIVYTSSAVKQKLNCQLTMQGISSKFTIMYPGYGVMVYSHEPAITITCDDIQHFNINSMPVNRCGDELCFPSKKNIPLNRL